MTVAATQISAPFSYPLLQAFCQQIMNSPQPTVMCQMLQLYSLMFSMYLLPVCMHEQMVGAL